MQFGIQSWVSALSLPPGSWFLSSQTGEGRQPSSPPPKNDSTCLPHRDVCPACQVQLRQFRPSAKCSISGCDRAKVSCIKPPSTPPVPPSIPLAFVCHYYPEFQKDLAKLNNRQAGNNSLVLLRTQSPDDEEDGERSQLSTENRLGLGELGRGRLSIQKGRLTR